MAAFVPAVARSSPVDRAWATWRERFVASDGRVIDSGQEGISHSEGQGYGLVLAQAFGDQKTFKRIENWSGEHLAIRRDALMAWKLDPLRAGSSTEWHNASDGDLFRAWAHLRAALQSGWPTDPAIAPAIVRDLAQLCLAPDPREPKQSLFLPGAEAQDAPGRILVNPSYYFLRAMRQLGATYEVPELVSAAEHGDDLLTDLAATGFLPDWIAVTSDGFAPPDAHDLRFAYDALRIPLYLVWSGQSDHPAVRVALQLLSRSDLDGHLGVWLQPDGTIRAQSNEPGFLAVATLADGGLPALSEEDIATQPYYPATLQILAHVAAREGRT